MDPEHQQGKLNIILVVGHARAGKDEVGRVVCRERSDALHIAFADKLKQVVALAFGVGPSLLHTEEGKSTEIREGWTYRKALQHVGTEGFRHVDPDVWARAALREAREALDDPDDPPTRIVVITDGRFLNEARLIRESGGVVWRVVRPGADGAVGIAGHSSETEQDAIVADVTIVNDGTIEDLRARVREALDGFMKERGL